MSDDTTEEKKTDGKASVELESNEASADDATAQAGGEVGGDAAAREVAPETLRVEELRAFVRARTLDAQIDLRRGRATILERLFELAPELRPPPSADELEEDELRARAKEGDEDAGDAIDEIERRRRELLEAERVFADAYAQTKPARPWLESHGLPIDVRAVSVPTLIDALFRLAAMVEAPPAELEDPLSAWIGLAMDRLDPETQARVVAHREATIRALEAATIERSTRPPSGPEYFIVERLARFVLDGYVHTLAQGSTVSTATHDVDELRRQGVPLLRCTAEQARAFIGPTAAGPR